MEPLNSFLCNNDLVPEMLKSNLIVSERQKQHQKDKQFQIVVIYFEHLIL